MDSVREQYVHQLVQKTQKFEKTECVIMGAFDIYVDLEYVMSCSNNIKKLLKTNEFEIILNILSLPCLNYEKKGD